MSDVDNYYARLELIVKRQNDDYINALNRIGNLKRELGLALRDNEALNRNLSSTQERCSKLLLALRGVRALVANLDAETVEDLDWNGWKQFTDVLDEP